MLRCWSIRDIDFAPQALLAAAIWCFFIAGCAKHDVRVAGARRFIKSQIRLLESPDLANVQHIQEYELPSFRAALRMLTDKVDSDFDVPVLFCAKIGMHTAGGKNLVGGRLDWLESGFKVEGVYIARENGTIAGEAPLPSMRETMSDVSKFTLMRHQDFAVVFRNEEVDATDRRSMAGPAFLLVLADRSQLSRSIRVGLVLNDGRHLPAIAASVDPAIAASSR